jgi:hypothetical protein
MIGLCLNPGCPTGRSCTGDMYCSGYELKDKEQIDTRNRFPIMPGRLAPDEQKQIDGIVMTVKERKRYFHVGDCVTLTLADHYRIEEIKQSSFVMTPLDGQGNPKDIPQEFRTGEHSLEKNWEMTEFVKGKANGSGPGLSI